MKRTAFILALFLTGILPFSCDKKDSVTRDNAWTVKPEGFSEVIYHSKKVTLSTQVYQVLVATSEDNSGGGSGGVSSSMTLFFSNIGPPPTGTYKVTSVDKLSGHEDQVAIYVQTFGDTRTGGNVTYWYSEEDSGQSISYTFANGKASASFNGIVIKQAGSGPQSGVVSANISQ